MIFPRQVRAAAPAVDEPGDGREAARTSLRFTAQPELDVQELWRVDADIRLTDGSTHVFTAQVEATPPGGGRWGLVVFLVPFLPFSGLWRRVFIRRSRTAASRTRSARPPCEAAYARRLPPPPLS